MTRIRGISIFSVVQASEVERVSSAWVFVATEFISKIDAVSPVTEPTGMAVPPGAYSVALPSRSVV